MRAGFDLRRTPRLRQLKPEQVGYIWLTQYGTGMTGTSQWGSAAMAVFYGICSALTLDKFALWLRLQDVY